MTSKQGLFLLGPSRTMTNFIALSCLPLKLALNTSMAKWGGNTWMCTNRECRTHQGPKCDSSTFQVETEIGLAGLGMPS